MPPADAGDPSCGCRRRAASTCAAGMRPRAAATNSDRAGSARPSAPASRTAVSWRAVRLMPRSRSLTDRGLTPAALASSACVSSASARSCRSNPANPVVACSAMTAASPPPALSPRPRQQPRRGKGLCQDYPGQVPAPPVPAPASPLPGPAPAAQTGARDRHAATGHRRGPAGLPRARRPPAPPAGALLWVSCAPHGCGSHRATATPGPTPARAGRLPAPPGAEPVIRPLPPRIPGRRSSYGGPESPQEQGAMAESAAARSSAPAGVPDPASRPGKQA